VLWVTNDYDNVIANRKRFTVRDINWLNFKPGDNPKWKMDVTIQVRHGPGWHFGNITHTPDGDPNSVRVMLEDRDQGLAAGQYAAFYDGDRCLGAGSIQHV
jgi:tRNA-specific 2-thiouridylase